MDQMQIDWQNVCQENSRRKYYWFLNKYPNSPYTDEARKLIAETVEQDDFDEGVKEHSMSYYIRKYPQGKLIQEAFDLSEKFKAQNLKRMFITTILCISVLAFFSIVLRDEYHTYTYFSSALIKFLIVESIVLIFFNWYKWKFLQFISLPSIFLFLLINLSPTVEFITSNQKGNTHRALFYYVKDTSGNNIQVIGHNIMNNTDKTLYVTHLEYTRNSKKVTGVEKINPGEVVKTTKIDQYFKEPPYRLEMDVLTRRTRKGHTHYRTIHYDERDLNVLDYYQY